MTSTSLLEEQVLKSDVLGRVRTPAERREALLDEFEKSGMSGTKFAQFIGVKYQTWASWVKMRRRRRQQQGAAMARKVPEAGAPALRFVEALVQAEATAARNKPVVPDHQLCVELPGGASVGIASREQLLLVGELLRILQHSERIPGC